MDDSAVWPRASGIALPAVAASMCNARRLLITLMDPSIRLSKNMALRAHDARSGNRFPAWRYRIRTIFRYVQRASLSPFDGAA